MSQMKDKMHTGELYFPGDGEIMEWQTKCLCEHGSWLIARGS